jgi:pilus assembly protein Flp/PilA
LENKGIHAPNCRTNLRDRKRILFQLKVLSLTVDEEAHDVVSAPHVMSGPENRWRAPRRRPHMKNLMKLFKDEEGATAVEYGLLVAAVAAVLITVAFFFMNRVGNAMNNAASHIN